MLIAHGLLSDLVSQLSSYSLVGIAPISWDNTEGQFKVKKSAMTCIGTVITFQLGVCLIAHDLYRLYYNSKSYQGSSSPIAYTSSSSGNGSGGTFSGNGDGVEKAFHRVQRLSCAVLLLMVALLHARNTKMAPALVALFNGMISFEQKYTGKLRLATDWKGKLTKNVCLLVRLANNLGPILISTLVVISEDNSPLNIVAFLTSTSAFSTSVVDIDNERNSGDMAASTTSGMAFITMSNQLVQRFITGTITALLNMIIWYMVVSIRSFWTCGQILIVCYGIRSALNLYASIMTRGKLLRITKEKIQEAVIYREIQLLSNLVNEVHGNPIFTLVLLFSSLLQTISLYLFVRFVVVANTTNQASTSLSSFFFAGLSSSSWTSRLFTAYLVFDGIFIVFVVFGAAAEVYLTSVQVKAALQSNEVFQRSEWFTQFFLSCPTIKLQCGSTNFILEGQFPSSTSISVGTGSCHCGVGGCGSLSTGRSGWSAAEELMMVRHGERCGTGRKLGNSAFNNNGTCGDGNCKLGNGRATPLTALHSGEMFDA